MWFGMEVEDGANTESEKSQRHFRIEMIIITCDMLGTDFLYIFCYFSVFRFRIFVFYPISRRFSIFFFSFSPVFLPMFCVLYCASIVRKCLNSPKTARSSFKPSEQDKYSFLYFIWNETNNRMKRWMVWCGPTHKV